MIFFKKSLEKASERHGIILLSIFYILVSSYLFNKYGVQFVNDSPRYIAYAKDLQQGFHFDPLNFWYLSFALFVMINQVLFSSLTAIVISQYVVGYFAMSALFYAVKTLTNNSHTAFFASSLFILFPDNLYWHSYILTESLYTSFLCFAFFALVKYYTKNSYKNLLFLTVILIICFFCRPTSPALLIAIMVPSFIKFLRNPAYRFLKISSCLALVVLLLLLANQMITMHNVMANYVEGNVIFAMHETGQSPSRDLLIIEPPADLFVPNSEGELIYEMISFVVNNPVYWIKMFSSKLIIYFSHIRPYWSIIHNLYALLIIWPCYFLCSIAFRKKLVPNTLVIVIIAYCAIHTLIVCNTWVDWDARFFVSLYPVIAYLSALAISNKVLGDIKTVPETLKSATSFRP